MLSTAVLDRPEATLAVVTLSTVLLVTLLPVLLLSGLLLLAASFADGDVQILDDRAESTLCPDASLIRFEITIK